MKDESLTIFLRLRSDNTAMSMKRAFDISAAALGITLLSPVLAAISLASLAHFRTNPLYFADRAGKDGKPFRMLKFKSLNDADSEDGKLLPDEQRSTPFGHFLRATALDECRSWSIS